ncbi:hypothetical protein EIL87_18075 [Saccharopolyspora rhizosphaerae]|uniref:Uncharacterized protein n=1 Tax=Saccharopolyspora rhizosphaerae TaxID=2492662 RepID=A0A3R8Q812_9PSEU|nr:hypothetical protein [Saccharopolyspora rhizosphaerae]RRO15168.1 hypothetical protein EIL87_18075 [Saccharopolyspora rhizosphaerae]
MSDNERQQGDSSPEEPTQQVPADAQGRIRYQDPESTAPREPTLAEQKARQMAEQRRAEAERAEQAAAAAKTAKRRKALIGGGATVGVVALVAAMYTASEVSAEANAAQQYCAQDQNGQAVAADPQNCDENYVRSQGGYVDHHSGFVFMPLFLGGPPVPSYRYAYTPAGSPAPRVGSTVPGSSFNKPSGTTIKDTKGSTIQRGGFGISSKSGGSGS